MKRHAAFTLIELLVVVAIITALIAILLPSLGKARAAAERAVCLSSERQIGFAWTAYVTSHRGALFDYTIQHAERDLWTESLRQYLNDASGVLICPSTEDPPGTQGTFNVGIAGVRIGGASLAWVEARSGYNYEEPFNHSSYTYNNNLHPKSSYNTTQERYQSFTEILQPQRVPILGDGDWREAHPGTPGALKLFPSDLDMPVTVMTGANADAVWRYAVNRHDMLGNILFVDGHGESVPLVDLWQLKWHKTYDTTTAVSGAP